MSLSNEFDDAWQILPCKHRFHQACVDEWLLRPGAGGVCPSCRVDPCVAVLAARREDVQPFAAPGGAGGAEGWSLTLNPKS